MKARMKANNLIKTNFVQKFFNGKQSTDGRKGLTKLEESQDGRKYVASSPNKSRQTQPSVQTPKRKLIDDNIFMGSPDKRRKLTFRENLQFWQTNSENTYTQGVPTNSALRYNSNNGRADQLADQCSSYSALQSRGKFVLTMDGSLPEELSKP